MGKEKKELSRGELINYHVVPPVFLVFFTAAAQYLPHVGNPDKPFRTEFLIGNGFAWKCIGALFAWAMFWLLVPSKKFNGPTTSFGLTPVYQVGNEVFWGQPQKPPAFTSIKIKSEGDG